MKKGGFWDDTFEKALEAGQSMAKSGGKQLKQTFSPANMIKNALNVEGTADLPADLSAGALAKAEGRGTAEVKGKANNQLLSTLPNSRKNIRIKINQRLMHFETDYSRWLKAAMRNS